MPQTRSRVALVEPRRQARVHNLHPHGHLVSVQRYLPPGRPLARHLGQEMNFGARNHARSFLWLFWSGGAGHLRDNNLQQQLLPLILTACRGHSGVYVRSTNTYKSPFRASQVVRASTCLSAPCIYAFNSQQRSYFTCADSKAKMGPIQNPT